MDADCIHTQSVSGRTIPKTKVSYFGTIFLAIILLINLMPAGELLALPFQDELDLEIDLTSSRIAEGHAKSFVQIDARVPHALLTFISTDDHFWSTYDLSADVYLVDDDQNRGRLVESKLWNVETTTPSFNLTDSDTVWSKSQAGIELLPGRYEMALHFEDAASSTAFTRVVPFSVRAFGKTVAMSDLLILESYENGEVIPRASNRIRADEPLIDFYYEVYLNREIKNVQVSYDVYRTAPGRPWYLAWLPFGIGQSRREAIISFTRSNSADLHAGVNLRTIAIPTQQLSIGNYEMIVKVADSDGILLSQAEKRISLEWNDVAFQVQNLDQAIAQLRYVAKPRDIQSILNAPNVTEKLARFEAFWEKRDPTPRSDRNERMEEFYFRVAFANKRYGRTMTEGWETDRGGVLIRFGQPNAIERRPGNRGATEVWVYQRIGREFVFVQQSGAFKLLVPIWDQ